MTPGSIPRRYAKALLAIGIEQKQFEIFGEQIGRFAELIKQPVLKDTLSNPVFSASKRKAVVSELIARMGLSPVVRNFLLLLVDRNRITVLPDIHREYRILADRHAGRLRAKLTSAQPLAAPELQQIKSALETSTGKQLLIEQSVDNTLIAGVVTQIGSVIFDGSVRTRLEQMRTSLLQGR